MTSDPTNGEVVLQPDLATMRIRIKPKDEGGQDQLCEIDVTNLALLGEEVERRFIPEGEEAARAWKPTPEFNTALAEVYNRARVLPIPINPTTAYTLYFEMIERWAELKKNMSFIPTSPSSTEPAPTSTTGDPTNSEPASEQT